MGGIEGEEKEGDSAQHLYFQIFLRIAYGLGRP